MFAYCNCNPIIFQDPSGTIVRFSTAMVRDDSPACGVSEYGPNIEFLMAFYGVESPGEVPEMPEGAMIFVENITGFTFGKAGGPVMGRTIVMDQYKYCEYSFVGWGYSYSKSMPLDRSVSQGYVYGVQHVEDYCGYFLGGSSNMLSMLNGGAIAPGGVYAVIMGGTGIAPSVSGSFTYYKTAQTDWVYGRANMVVLPNPYSYSVFGSSYSI